MFAMFNRFFSALSALFTALENVGNAGAIVSEVAVDKAKAYRDEERIKIKATLKLRQQEAENGTLAIAASTAAAE